MMGKAKRSRAGMGIDEGSLQERHVSQLAKGSQPTLEVGAKGEIQETKWTLGGENSKGPEGGAYLVI